MAKPVLSLRDVAKEAGVHFTTVSLALRNDPRLPETTRKRIQAVARRLGYRTHPLMTSLISSLKRSKIPTEFSVIGFLDTLSRPTGLPRRSPAGDPFYEGAMARARDLGYKIEPLLLKSPGMTARRMTTILQTRAIRGLIVDSNWRPSGHLSLKVDSFACCMRGYSNLRPNLSRVCHNHFQGALLAGHSLGHLGYRRIGLVLSHGLDKLVNYQWRTGLFIHQQQGAQADRIPPLLYDEYRAPALLQWVKRHRPDVILGVDKRIPASLRQAGIPVPGEIGFANLDLDQSRDSTHAGIWQNLEIVGAAAVDSVVAQLQRNEYGVPQFPKLTMIEGVWRDGPTVRPRK